MYFTIPIIYIYSYVIFSRSSPPSPRCVTLPMQTTTVIEITAKSSPRSSIPHFPMGRPEDLNDPNII